MEIIIGIAAGILTSISMLPQLVKVITEKDVENLSGVMISVLLIGVILWVAYGIIKNEWPIIIPNVFSVLVNSLLLIYFFKFKKIDHKTT